MSANLDSVLIHKAVSSLLKFEEKKQSEKGKQSLVGYYAKPVLAQIQLKKAIRKPVIRPVRVKIPHSMFSVDEEDHTVCLFCRSDDKKSIEEYLAGNPVEGLTKVVSINDVRKLYNAFKDRKKLLSEHTHFICDSNIVSQLYNLLGKTFSDNNNYPVPVSYSSPEKIAAAMEKVVSSSYMHLKGHTITIRMGLTNMIAKNVAENVVQGLEFAVPKFTNGWKDVHSIHLKLSDSPALPIYAKVPSDALGFVAGKAKGGDAAAEGVDEATGVKGKAAGKGKAAAATAAAATGAKGGKKGKAAAAEEPVEEEKKAGKKAPAKAAPAKAAAVATKAVAEETAESGKKRGRPASAPAATSAAAPVKGAGKKAAGKAAAVTSADDADADESEVATRARPIKRIKSTVVKTKK